MTHDEWEARRQEHLARQREKAQAKWEVNESHRQRKIDHEVRKAKGCTSKVAYPTAGMAAVAAQEWLRINKSTRMATYRCPFGCGNWHLTRQISGASSEGYLVIDVQDVKTNDELAVRRKKKIQEQYEKRHATAVANWQARKGNAR